MTIEFLPVGTFPCHSVHSKVFSWKRTQGTYDMGSSDGDQPRAYISIISEMTHDADKCEGAANDDVGEGRMDSESASVVPMVPAWLQWSNR